jgi:hypothetical protein
MKQVPEQQEPEQQQPHGHPYGVQPWGNFYMTGVPEIRTAGGQLARCSTTMRHLQQHDISQHVPVF